MSEPVAPPARPSECDTIMEHQSLDGNITPKSDTFFVKCETNLGDGESTLTSYSGHDMNLDHGVESEECVPD